MELRDHLLEVQLKTARSINGLFNLALRQAFQPEFLRKIENTIHNTIKVKEVEEKNNNIIAWNRGGTIFINKRSFGALPISKKMNYLLHEFMHILQTMKRFFLFRGFKEINNMTLDLYDMVERNLTKPYNVFLTKKNIGIGSGGKYEILAYLMNGSLDWSALTEEGQKKFVEILREYNVFNLESQFMKERLP